MNEPMQAEVEKMCDHRCILDDDHVERGEPHYYGYRLPVESDPLCDHPMHRNRLPMDPSRCPKCGEKL